MPAFRWCVDRQSPRARNVGAVVATIGRVRDEALAALGEGSTVLVLGGDCTTGLGAMAALMAIDPSAGLVYLNLHADMNVPSSVTDGALDWMGLGHALDLPGAVPEVAATCSLTAGQVVLCGYSEMHATKFEREQVTRMGVQTVTDEEVAADPVRGADAALAATGNRETVAVHFDVDLVDFGQVPLSEHTGANQGMSTSVTRSTRSSPHLDWICSPAGGSNRNVSSEIGWLNAAASVMILWNGCSSRIAVTASRTPSCRSTSIS